MEFKYKIELILVGRYTQDTYLFYIYLYVPICIKIYECQTFLQG